MLQLKKKALALGMAALLLLPGTVYGQSSEPVETDWKDCFAQFFQFLEDWGICLENGNLPETPDVPEIEEAIPQLGLARVMLAQVNKQRRSAGLSELSLSQELTKVAQIKAEDMRDQGYFGHTSPNYGSPFEMMQEFGINYGTAGENIAQGQPSVESVMAGWMNSSGHRANILNENFTQLGVGYCIDEAGNTYWVQMFIGE